MLCINKALVDELYTPEVAIEDCKKAFAVIAGKDFTAPIRSSVTTKNQDLYLMPSAVHESDESTDLAVKIISIVPKNRERGLPLIPGKVCLFDDETGSMLSLIDGFMVTNKRTGAVAGASASVLHKSPAENVVLFGCGAQGFYGLDSILFAHPEVKKITVFDYFKAAAEKFVQTHKALNDGREYVVGENTEAAVREADIIHAATTSQQCLFKAEWVKKGAHISAIGCYRLDMRELPNELFAMPEARIFIDEFEAMRSEAGDVMDAINNGFIKEENINLFGDVIRGKVEGRQNENQITVMKAVGLAPQDTVAASTIYKLAKQQGKGVLVDI